MPISNKDEDADRDAGARIYQAVHDAGVSHQRRGGDAETMLLECWRRLSRHLLMRGVPTHILASHLAACAVVAEAICSDEYL